MMDPCLNPLTEAMKVKLECSKLVKPIYQGDPPLTTQQLPLSIFDLITDDGHIPLIYAYRSPTPSNAALKLGLRKVLSAYREFAGRFAVNTKTHNRVILLNDEGVRVVEASASCTLDQAMLLKPSPKLLSLHPCLDRVHELAVIQLTRFTCGSLAVGISTHHMVADGYYASQFFVAWGRACRSLQIKPVLLRDRKIFIPRNPPRFEFEHRGVEFTTKHDASAVENAGDLVMNKFRFSLEFLLQIKSKALHFDPSSQKKPYTKFECLMAHVWKTVAKACENDGYKHTRLKIAVNGLTRLDIDIPREYLGNLVLWAFPRAELKEVVSRPLTYGLKLIHEAVSKVNDSYFKSFIDFASCRVDEEGLVPKSSFSDNVTSLNMNIDSWLGFPFSDLDFGGGKPCILMPAYRLWRGQIYVVPSVDGDGSVDVFLALHPRQMDAFTQICYLLQ